MIKTVSYFPLQCSLNSGPVVGAVLSSLRSAGATVEPNSWDSDAVIIWSVLWHGRMSANQAVYYHYRSQNKPVIVLEVGALDRGRTWKVCLNNVTAQGYYGHTENLDWDRPAKLGIKLKNNANSTPWIVIAMQHSKSLQMHNVDQSQWLAHTIAQLKKHTDRPILVRPHPRSPLTQIKLPPGVNFQAPIKLPDTYDSFDMDYGCHAVVNYNSGPGIQAAIAGTRCMVDQTSLAWPVSVQFSDVEKPYTLNREQWLVEICHTEYTVEELQQGLWLKRLGL